MPTCVRLACLTALIALAGSSSSWCQESEINVQDESEAKIQRLIRERKHREELKAREQTTLDEGASVNPALLDVVSDDSFGIRYDERDIYFRMLELAVKTPLSLQERYMKDFREERRQANYELARQNLGVPLTSVPEGRERSRMILARNMQRRPDKFSTFQELYLYPDENRGRPVSVQGVLRKLTKFDPGENSRGIDDVYEGWIYTDDGRVKIKKLNEDGKEDTTEEAMPTVVVFVNKPEHLEVSGDLTEEVRLTGYFFKLYTYHGQNKTTRAPMILAGEIEWRPRTVEPRKRPPLEVYLGVTLLALLVAYVVWLNNRVEMTSQIHPRVEADFSKFPPLERPRMEFTEGEKHPSETNDS